MVAALTWRPRQPSSEGTNATYQTSTNPAARITDPAREMVRQFFLVAFLFLILCGDVETNPGPSCYAFGQNKCAGGVVEKGNGDMTVQSMGEMGKDFCPDFLQPFHEIIGNGSRYDGGRELIPIFLNPHRKCKPSPSVVARVLERLVGW